MKPIAFGLTDVGRCRKVNEDELLVDAGRGVFAVADGMGGHAAGEVASGLAIRALADTMSQIDDNGGLADPHQAAQSLAAAFHEGNRKICESVVGHDEWQGMGTTIVALWTRGDQAVIGHVGDSRCYRLRGGKLGLLTSDHSLVNEKVKLGLLTEAEARRHPMRNIVTRALGNRPELEVDVSQAEVRSGDTFLLCSDGLNSMLRDEEIEATLVRHHDDPEAACQQLVDQANARGGEDNVTVIVMHAP